MDIAHSASRLQERPVSVGASIARAAGWLFWGFVIYIVDFTITVDTFRLDLLHDTLGALLMFIGLFQLSFRRSAHPYYRSAIVTALLVAFATIAETAARQVMPRFLTEPPYGWFIAAVFPLVQMVAFVLTLLALGWLCRENGLVSAARNWSRTLSIFSVTYILPMLGITFYSLFVRGGTFNFTPNAELLPLRLEIVPILLIWAFMAVPIFAAYLTLRTMRSETVVANESGQARPGRFNPVWLGLGGLVLVIVAAFIVNFLVFSSHPKLAWEYPFDDGAIAVAPDGKIYAFERIQKQLLVLDSDGKLLKTVELNLKPGARLEDAAIGTDGNLYVVDSLYQSVYKFDRDGNLLKSWGAGVTAKVNKDALAIPQGIALDAQNNVYVTNQTGYKISKFDSEGQHTKDFGLIIPELGQPKGVALDTQGNVYVADMSDERIKKLNPTGVVTQEWGGRGNERGAFNMVFGVATDRNGFVYAADMHNHRIQKFDASGRFVTQWFTGTSFPNGPNQIKIGSDGAVYVINGANEKIQKFIF